MVRVVLALKLARLTIAAVHDDEQQQDDDYDGDPDHAALPSFCLCPPQARAAIETPELHFTPRLA